jgi:hypothetical protein
VKSNQSWQTFGLRFRLPSKDITTIAAIDTLAPTIISTSV